MSCVGRTSDVSVPLPSFFGSVKQSDREETSLDDGEARPHTTHADEEQQPRHTSNGAGSLPTSPVLTPQCMPIFYEAASLHCT